MQCVSSTAETAVSTRGAHHRQDGGRVLQDEDVRGGGGPR